MSVVWECEIAQTPEELSPPMPRTSSQPDGFGEKKRERIKAFELEESDNENEDSADEVQNMNVQNGDIKGRVKNVKPHRSLPTPWERHFLEDVEGPNVCHPRIQERARKEYFAK